MTRRVNSIGECDCPAKGMHCPIGVLGDAFVVFAENNLTSTEIAEVIEMLERTESQNVVAVELFPWLVKQLVE